MHVQIFKETHIWTTCIHPAIILFKDTISERMANCYWVYLHHHFRFHRHHFLSTISSFSVSFAFPSPSWPESTGMSLLLVLPTWRINLLEQVIRCRNNSGLKYTWPKGLGAEDDSLGLIFVEFIDSLFWKTLKSHYTVLKGLLITTRLFSYLKMQSVWQRKFLSRTNRGWNLGP